MPKTLPTYNSGFRQEAVNLLISSQRPLKAVAAELGISANSLRTWSATFDGFAALRAALRALDLRSAPVLTSRPARAGFIRSLFSIC